MIYLVESESQGLALAEAWLRNVPTFVWNRGYWQYGNYSWRDDKISAPYLTDECGLFFRDYNDFKEKLPLFLTKLSQFQPRKYALNNFIDVITTRKYLEIINEAVKNEGEPN